MCAKGPSVISLRVLLVSGLGVVGAALVACGSNDDGGKASGRFDDVVEEPKADGGPSDPVADGDSGSSSAQTAEPTSDAGPAPSRDAGNGGGSNATCRTARDLGAISGDTGTPTLSAQGKCGDWLRVRVTEDDHGVFANNLKLTATLVSPSGRDFDLALYVNKDADALECTTATDKSDLPAGRSDIVKLEWGEVYAGNLGDDSRTVSIQVTPKTGGCTQEAWTLLLQGNY